MIFHFVYVLQEKLVLQGTNVVVWPEDMENADQGHHDMSFLAHMHFLRLVYV